MKAKFKLGFLTGFKNVPDAWPGTRHTIPLLEAATIVPSNDGKNHYKSPPLKSMIFECRKIDEDKAAIFELLEIK